MTMRKRAAAAMIPGGSWRREKLWSPSGNEDEVGIGQVRCGSHVLRSMMVVVHADGTCSGDHGDGLALTGTGIATD